MFDLLKKKLSKAIDSISKKAREKSETDSKEEKLYPEKSLEINLSEDTSVKRKDVEKSIRTEDEIKRSSKLKKVSVKKKHKPFIREAFEKVAKKLTEKKIDEKDLDPILDELEIDLIEADVALEVAEKIKHGLRNELVGKEIRRGEEKTVIISAFKKTILDILSVETVDLKAIALEKKPVVMLFIGFNGSGKTTSIAKAANWIKKNGMTPVIAAADTFRAASIEQLEEHAQNLNVKVIKHKYGSDPAAVIYDAVEHAKSKRIEFVLADSAGRVHTNENLMKELKKIVKVNKPDLKILVIDSLTGNDALVQARSFGEIGIDAVIFTKIDVNEKGGSILSVTNELRKPILFLGTGQGYDEFVKFDADKFIETILG